MKFIDSYYKLFSKKNTEFVIKEPVWELELSVIKSISIGNENTQLLFSK